MALKLKALTIDEKKDTVTKTEFDHANRKVRVTDALGHKDSFTWNALGKVTSHTNRAGQVYNYAHDTAYRLTEEISPETTITEIQAQNGHLQSLDKKTKLTKRYQLDKDNNIVAIIEGADLQEERSVHFSFDAKHNSTGTTINNVKINDKTKPADFSHLPVQEKTLTTKIIYNTKGHKIAEQNEAGIWSYCIYDALERLVYEVQKEKVVIGYTYNAFNQKETVRGYHTPCTLDLTHYRETGEVDTKFFAAYPETPEDRVTTFEYDAAGEEINVKKGEVLYYDKGQIGTAQPETKKAYTPFGDCFYEAVLISPGKWAENYKWFDHQGKVIAEVNENRYLVRYERDVKGNVTKKTEYATALTLPLSKDIARNLSVEELDKHCVPDQKDRATTYEYDVLGQKIKEKKLKAVTQEVTFNVQHVPDMKDKPAADEETNWTYTPTQKLAVTTYSTGEKEHHYYDERDILIGTAKPTFTQVHEEGAPKVTPLTVYKVNAFGQTVVKQESPKGCVTPQENVLPAFSDPHEIYEELSKFDNQGLLETKQNAANHVNAFTYTETKKIARQLDAAFSWIPKTNHPQEMEEDFYVVPREALEDKWADVNKNPEVPTDTVSVGEPAPPTFIQIPHVDEQQIEYDAFDQPIQLSYCRDGYVEQTTHSRYTIFGDFEAEGPNGTEWPLQLKMDANGHAYYTNAEKGAGTFQLHDLRNRETLRLQASQKDLSTISYNAVPSLLQEDAKEIERTETVHDDAGNVIAKKFPVWFRDKNALPSRQYEVDHWHNVVKEIDSLGHETDSEFNHQNQLIKLTQPETDVLDENGVLHRERPETQYGYNARGFHIGTKNADSRTEAHLVDELGRLITEVLPDGTFKTRNFLDALGRIVHMRDARYNLWSQQYDRMGNITEALFPSGNSIAKTYDGKGGLASVTDWYYDPKSKAKSPVFTMRYNNDVRGHVCLTYYPFGHVVHHLCDRNGLPNKIWRSGEEPLLWNRDYFGHPYWHQDLGNHIEYSTYDNKMQLFTVKRDNGAPSPSMSYTEKCDNKDAVCPVIYYKAAFLKTHSVKDLTYDYAYGHLEYKTDKGLNTKTQHKVDAEGRCEEIAISDLTTSTLLNKRQTQFDEMGRESYTTHAHMTGEKKLGLFSSRTKYDALDNRRLVHSELAPVGYADCCIPPVIKRDDWFTYDTASRVKILNGVLQNGTIQAGANTIAFDYALDLRTGETSVYASSSPNPMLVTLTHNEDGLLKESVSPSPLHLHAVFEYQCGWINKVAESSPLGKKVSTAIQDKNGWMESLTVESTDNHYKTHTKNYTFNEYPGCSEQPDRTSTTTTDLNKKNEIIAKECNVIDYLKFDTKLPTAVTTTRWKIHLGQTTTRAEQGLDANGNINGKHYSRDESPNSNIYLENTSDGLVLFKQGFNVKDIIQYHFLYNTQDEAKALYYINYNYNEAMNHAYSLKNHHHHIPTVPKVLDSDFVIPTPVRRAGRFNFKPSDGKNGPLNCNDPHYADMGPQFYTVETGDTLEKIAWKIYGDIEAAETLARFNGLLSMEHSLRAGHVLKLPPYMGSHNKANVARPYNQLKAIILGHLSTYIIFPKPKKPHQDVFGNLIKLIALAVIIYTAPILAGHLLGSAALLGTAGTAATLSSTDIIVTGIVAALEDAAVQGLAVGLLGIQSKFSFAEALETGITAGLGLTLGAKTMEEIAQSALKIGTTATATQLIEMKAGLRDKFDARGVALQVSAFLASAGINKVMGNSANHMNTAAKNVVSTGANAVLGHAISGAPLSIQNIAANAIGSTVGDELGQELAESLSTPTHASKPAAGSSAARKQQQRQPSRHQQAEEELEFVFDDALSPLPNPTLDTSSIGYQTDSSTAYLGHLNASQMNHRYEGTNVQSFSEGFFSNIRNQWAEVKQATKAVWSNPASAINALESRVNDNFKINSNPGLWKANVEDQNKAFEQQMSKIYNEASFGCYGELGSEIADVVPILVPFGKAVGVVGVAGKLLGAGKILTAGKALSASKLGFFAGSTRKMEKLVKSETILYQKLGPDGEHLKFGITKNPETRYTSDQLGGGRLKIIARGTRQEMLELERNLHETLPIGPEERQSFYIKKQVEKDLLPPPYGR